jgi:hypothetical protein
MILSIGVVISLLLLSGWKIVQFGINLGILNILIVAPTDAITPPNISPGISGTSISRDNSVPVIQNIMERERYRGGELILYKDIYFVDEGGNADLVMYDLTYTDFKGISVDNDPISSTPEDQKRGAVVTGTWRCGARKYTVILRARIHDTADNYSEPEDIEFICH